jgi:hypothetical protein
LAREYHDTDHPLAQAMLMDSENWAGAIWLGDRRV